MSEENTTPEVVTEEVVLRLARTVHKETGQKNLCLAGGVALNCVANGRLLREGPFESIWIQPASGDAGGAIGAALSVHHEYLEKTRATSNTDSMQGSYLGPSFNQKEIKEYLDSVNASYTQLQDDELFKSAAEILENENTIAAMNGQ